MLAADPVDLADLAGAEAFGRIEAPDAFQQSLAPQHLVTAGDAAMEIVGDVEKRAVAVGDTGIERQQVVWNRTPALRGAAQLELFDRARGPHRPVSKEAATDMGTGGDAAVAQIERQDKIEQDVIVIAGVERDPVERA